MEIRLIDDANALAGAAAGVGADTVRAALVTHGEANLVLATGMSQLGMLNVLARAPGIDWSRVTVFHLDEYIGLSPAHPASFRRYLRERFLALLPAQPRFVAIEGDAPDLAAELVRLNGVLKGRRVDLCFAGIGENGHLAFNDPPADFDVDSGFIAVNLDDTCRHQQFTQGWFATLADVPARAISMSIRQIMRSARLVLSAPELRKADALHRALEGPVDPDCPASIIQRHPDCVVFLDMAAASGLHRPPVRSS